MRYAFIEHHRSQWPITVQCRVLGISRKGYYAWRRGCHSLRKKQDAELIPQILAVHRKARFTYGAEWIAKELRDSGQRVGKQRTGRLMRAMGLRVIGKQRWKTPGTTTSTAAPPSPDLVNRNFNRTTPNELWLSDFTELPSKGAKIYAVGIKDQASRRIVGMVVSHSMDTSTLLSAFHRAVHLRKFHIHRPTNPVIFHSDRGGQFNAKAFKETLSQYNFLSSMGSTGDCYDNAPMESFWATLKTELYDYFPFANLDHAKSVVYRWLHLFYNPYRRHTSINGLSPIRYEQLWEQNHILINAA